MTLDEKLRAVRDAIQHDPGNRGLARDPERNLFNACPDDFADACRSIAAASYPRLGVVTGFLIPTADPPRPETDGPLGALFLARALDALQLPMLLATDEFCLPALQAGIEYASLKKTAAFPLDLVAPGKPLTGLMNTLTHVAALERVGPSHTPESLKLQSGGWANDLVAFVKECPPASFNRCHTMRGHDVTDAVFPASSLFELPPSNRPLPTTIGIGDGGNEIGMGKIPWETIRRNIPNGGKVACRVATNHLIVAGVSNWGAYALAAGIALCLGETLPKELFDPASERELLEAMIEAGDLVDGVTNRATATVDGLSFERYIQPLLKIREIMEA